jgi:hypothetical protein
MTLRELLACAPDSPVEAFGEAAVAVLIVMGLPVILPVLFWIGGAA